MSFSKLRRCRPAPHRLGSSRFGGCAALFLAVVLGLLCAELQAGPVERDLGNGLLYWRVHALPADQPSDAAGRAGPCVVDVRYVEANAEAATAFAAWLKSRASPRSPVFVLANSDTSTALLKPLAPRLPGVAVVGIERGRFRPDVPVKSSADDERRAYDALEQGASVATLLAENPSKVRNDEASLSKDRLAQASADAATEVVAGKRVAPPIDATLQRAVHLHRALLALKRL